MWGADIVSEAQWSETMNDGRRFVAAGSPHQAAALGWTEENASGLIWSLRGRRGVAMTGKAPARLVDQRKCEWILSKPMLSAARSRACEGTI
jgi:hypothetical protein